MRDDGALGADDGHTLGRLLNLAAKAARSHAERRLSSAGSSFAVWTALFALRAKGPLIQRELARLLNVEGPTLTRRLARMEAQGLVERHRTSADRRAAVVRLTPAGEVAHDRLAAIVAASGDVALQGFSPREIEEFAGYLGRLIANVEAASPAQRATRRA
jgi:MarR family transcriptional regulator, transcriptional regulator for hemolysin